MSEIPKFDEFTAELPSRAHPIARAKMIGAKAIELEGGRYHALPFSDQAKDNGVWLPASHIYTLGRLRRLHRKKYTDQLFASTERSARQVTVELNKLTKTYEHLTDSSEQLLDILDQRDQARINLQGEELNG